MSNFAMNASRHTYIDDRLHSWHAFWLLDDHYCLLNIAEDQVHMPIIRLRNASKYRDARLAGRTYVKNSLELAIPSEFDKDALAQREPDKVKGLLDALLRSVHHSVSFNAISIFDIFEKGTNATGGESREAYMGAELKGPKDCAGSP